MATVMRRHRSRRRVAAVTFLSNISLDGTFRDTKLALLAKRDISEEPASCCDKSAAVTFAVSRKENVDSGGSSTAVRAHQHHHHLGTRSASAVVGGVVSHPAGLTTAASAGAVSAPCSEISFAADIEGGAATDRACTMAITCDSRDHVFSKGVRRKLQHQQSLQAGSSKESLGGRSRKTSGSMSDSSASSGREVRFLSATKEQDIRDERVVLVSSQKIPFLVFSSLPYTRRNINNQPWKADPKVVETVRRRHASSSGRPLSAISDGNDLFGFLGIEKCDDGQDISYSQFLVPSRSYCQQQQQQLQQRRFLSQEAEIATVSQSGIQHPHLGRFYSCDPSMSRPPHKVAGVSPVADKSLDPDDLFSTALNTAMPCYSLQQLSTGQYYTPNLLDDPELMAGKHRTVLTFSSYMTSVIDYVRPSDLKKELNDKFHERFPHIQLTLSKLRSLKREMKKIAKNECGIDLLTVAQSHVYFEKLILRNLVNKQNRKLCAGACVLLSAKLNDVKGPDLKQLFEKIETVFRVNRKDLLFSEFAVLVAMEFSLHLPTWEILPHYQRLLYES